MNLFDSNPFNFSNESRLLFLSSFKENAIHHYNHSKLIHSFFDEAGFHPDQLLSENDLSRVPPIMVHLFKEHAFKSVPDSEIVLSLTSSGTGGVKSKQYLNAESLTNVKRLAYQIHHYLGMTSQENYNYVCFTYDPAVANDLGTAFTDELLTNFTGKKEVFYAIQWNKEKNDFEFKPNETIAALKRFEKSGIPVRILGFPAFLVQLIHDHGLQLNLGETSWLQTGGGWKTSADKEISKEDFRNLTSSALGIPKENIRDLFGMVEHGIPYVDCEKGNLHIPNYSRVYIRSPYDLSLLEEGMTGLIHFLCSYNTSYPAASLLTTDYGAIGTCDCAIGKAGSKVLLLKGRAGITQNKGCAIKALELIQKKGAIL